MNLRTSLAFILLFSCASLLSTVLSELQGSDLYPIVYKENCVFPFTYKGNTYTDCTTDGDNGNTAWCSMTENYQGLINYCYDFRTTTLNCSLPFKVNSIDFDSCDYISKTSMYKQCKVENSTVRYRYCTDVFDSPTLKKMDNRANCDPRYKKLSAYHTMCYGPSPYANAIPITEDEKQELLDIHNNYRSAVSSRYMFKLYWDDELAKLAQAHTGLCAFEHDLAVNRLSPKFNWKNGQNIVMSTDIRSSPGSLIDIMLDSEQGNFYYGSNCSPGDNTCLHYTQAMISNLTRVGCGQSHCVYPDRIERFVTCNYIQSQYEDNYRTPYVPHNVSAIDCPLHQDGNLCDCGDKICAYDRGEYLDPATCTCMGSKSKRSIHSVDVNENDVAQQGFVAIKTANLPKLSKRSLRKFKHDNP